MYLTDFTVRHESVYCTLIINIRVVHEQSINFLRVVLLGDSAECADELIHRLALRPLRHFLNLLGTGLLGYFSKEVLRRLILTVKDIGTAGLTVLADCYESRSYITYIYESVSAGYCRNLVFQILLKDLVHVVIIRESGTDDKRRKKE